MKLIFQIIKNSQIIKQAKQSQNTNAQFIQTSIQSKTMNKLNIQAASLEQSPKQNYSYSSGLSIQSLLRQKSYLQSKLRQVELQLQEKEYYYQQIQEKSKENRQLYSQIVKDFNEFRKKMQHIAQQKDSMIDQVNSQLKVYQQSQGKLIKQLETYENSFLKISQENNRLKKQIIQKNIFIECYLKKDKEFAFNQQKRKQHTSHKKKYHHNLYSSPTKNQTPQPMIESSQKATEQQ